MFSPITTGHNSVLGKALRNEKVVSFVKFILKSSYHDFFPDKEKEVEEMIDEVFSKLVASQKDGINEEKLEEVAFEIYQTVFRAGDLGFWFNSRYRKYKSSSKPKAELSVIKKHILGKKILDFGSGLGYLSLFLDKEGFKIISTDVLDNRHKEVSHIEFRRMADSSHIPCLDDNIDTVIIKTVFHHINNSDILKIVSDLGRIAKRVLVVEDIYDANQDLVYSKLGRNKKLDNFFALSKKERLQSCILIDYYGNSIAQGIMEMNFPFTFKTVGQWSEIMQNNGFAKSKTKWLGFSNYNLHGFFQSLMVFDRY